MSTGGNKSIEQLERRVAELESENETLRFSVSNALDVLDAAKNVTEDKDHPVSLQELLDYAIELFPLANAGLISAFNEETGYDDVLALNNHDPKVFSQLHLKPNQGATGWSYTSGQARIWNGIDGVYECINNVENSIKQRLLESDGRLSSSLMCAPLMVRGKPIGAIQIEHFGDDRQFTPLDLSLLENMVANPLAIALDNFRLAEQIRAKNQEMRSLLQRTITSQEDERTRVARELHDNVAQTLAGLRIAVLNVRSLVKGFPGSEGIVEYLGELDGQILETIEMTRNLAIDLRPGVLNDMGLESALRWYLRERVARAGTQTHIAVDGIDETELEPWLTTTLFRVAQEAFSNVVRHAKAGNIYVTLMADDHKVQLSIRDDGCGFTVEDKMQNRFDHIGLSGMEERMSMIGGSFEIFSRQGEGTVVTATAPKRRDGM